MKALIIAAHGSRKKESAMEVGRLARKIQGIALDTRVAHGFLQFSEPFLPQVIEDLVGEGVTDMVIFPFFISAGSHVNIDIPEMVEDARQKHPGVEFSITRHLGILEGVEELILLEALGKAS